APAWQNLAAIHDARGEDEAARRCREQAYRLQRVFVEALDAPTRRLLVLCAGAAAGNVPFETLLSSGRSLLIKYAIDFAASAEDAALPPFDLVFNAIGDADIAAPLAARLEGFAQRCRKPLLNHPVAVARTRRDRLPALLEGLDAAETAPCIRLDAAPANATDLRRLLEAAGLEAPLLVRPAASHGGLGLTRCESVAAAFEALHALGGAGYLTAFRDSRDPDGCWRKYRVVFVDREPLPYHLAISGAWMVHYRSAGMEGQAGRLAEEARFLADPEAALGAPAWAALREIGRRLDLDYAGIDFTLRPDGRLLVFEANATMLVHRERRDGPLARKNTAVQAIAEAFERRLRQVAGA
ncbi:MAG: hypothetical protein KGM91_07195, partial [Burkholderiales bacterium]|nr:hypothetical protein [Burkholderiales bacterium]